MTREKFAVYVPRTPGGERDSVFIACEVLASTNNAIVVCARSCGIAPAEFVGLVLDTFEPQMSQLADAVAAAQKKRAG